MKGKRVTIGVISTVIILKLFLDISPSSFVINLITNGARIFFKMEVKKACKFSWALHVSINRNMTGYCWTFV